MNIKPEWWAKARAMKDRGVRPGTIARLMKKDRKTILYAVDDEYRARHAARVLEHNRNNPRRRDQYPRDRKRDRIRAEARFRWQEDGFVRSLHSYYRELECL